MLPGPLRHRHPEVAPSHRGTPGPAFPAPPARSCPNPAILPSLSFHPHPSHSIPVPTLAPSPAHPPPRQTPQILLEEGSRGMNEAAWDPPPHNKSDGPWAHGAEQTPRAGGKAGWGGMDTRWYPTTLQPSRRTVPRLPPATHLHPRRASCWVKPRCSSLAWELEPPPPAEPLLLLLRQPGPPSPSSRSQRPTSAPAPLQLPLGRSAWPAATDGPKVLVRLGGGGIGGGWGCIKTTHTLYSQPPLLDQPDKWVKGIGLSH